LKLIKLRGVDENGEIVPVTIKSVVQSGTQLVYKLITESGHALRATAKHNILTSDGWKRLEELSVGDYVKSNGVEALDNPEYLRHMYLELNMERSALAAHLGVADSTLGKRLAKYGLQKPKSQYPNRSEYFITGNHNSRVVPNKEREETSLRMQGEGNHRWKGDDALPGAGRLRANRIYTTDGCGCVGCGSTKILERHHLDRNPLNNAPENIKILCAKCHKAYHLGQGVLTVYSDPIMSIEPDGMVMTYDIEIDGEPHNFVANGIVVHNSQQSQRYVDGKNFGFVTPPEIAGNEEALAIYTECLAHMKVAYERLRNKGIKKEDARFLLPNATTTSLVITANFREWRHIIKERGLNKHAQWEIRELSLKILRALYDVAPNVFGDLYKEAFSDAS